MRSNIVLLMLLISSRPYYTSADYVGYKAADGNCRGNDITSIEISPEECAAKCTITPECVGWVYIFQGTTNQLLPCYLKKVMCWSPIIENTYTYKSYFKVPTEVAGYKTVDGDCGGNDIKFVQGSPQECAAHCTSIPECTGWVYIIPGTSEWRGLPCALKRKMCEKAWINTNHIDTSYIKIREEMTVFQEASQISLTSTPGLAASLIRSRFDCARKCHRDADCTYFSVSENGGKYSCDMTSSMQLPAPAPPTTPYYKKQSVIKS